MVVDYKTASGSDDLDARVGHYRGQGATYALAVQEATGEPVSRVVFVFLTPDGVRERRLPDLDAAMQQVTALVADRPDTA